MLCLHCYQMPWANPSATAPIFIESVLTYCLHPWMMSCRSCVLQLMTSHAFVSWLKAGLTKVRSRHFPPLFEKQSPKENLERGNMMKKPRRLKRHWRKWEEFQVMHTILYINTHKRDEFLPTDTFMLSITHTLTMIILVPCMNCVYMYMHFHGYTILHVCRLWPCFHKFVLLCLCMYTVHQMEVKTV